MDDRLQNVLGRLRRFYTFHQFLCLLYLAIFQRVNRQIQSRLGQNADKGRENTQCTIAPTKNDLIVFDKSANVALGLFDRFQLFLGTAPIVLTEVVACAQIQRRWT